MITVKRESDLETQTWEFRYSERDHMLALVSWERWIRPTTKREYRCVGAWQWSRTVRRHSVPPDVIDEARRRFVETLKVEP